MSENVFIVGKPYAEINVDAFSSSDLGQILRRYIETWRKLHSKSQKSASSALKGELRVLLLRRS